MLKNFEQSLFTTNEINFVAVDHEVSMSLIPKIAVGDEEVEILSIFFQPVFLRYINLNDKFPSHLPPPK